MSKACDRCHEFGRGLYRGGLGAGVGLVVFFAAYLVMFATRGPITAEGWFSPGSSITSELLSFIFVTTAGLLGRRTVSVWCVVTGSCIAALVSFWLVPLTEMGWTTRKALLLENPLFEFEYVWFVFAFNVVAIAVSYASAPRHLECSRTAHEEETLTR